jgi:WD40 repeat protein
MTKEFPPIDTRKLKDLLDQLKKLAKDKVPDWTPPSPPEEDAGTWTLSRSPEGDAGTMLQVIFARLMEIAIERLNQVPNKHLLAFLDTMGVSLLPPSPAEVPLTFTLAPGTSPTRIPQGTQVGTQPADGQTAVTFETDDDLTVIPAQLTAGFTVDPTWDRYANLTPLLSGQSVPGFTPFVGTKQMEHILHLGDDQLLQFSREADVVVSFACGDKSPDQQDIIQFFQSLTYQCQTQNQLEFVKLDTVKAESPKSLELLFRPSKAIDPTSLQITNPAKVVQSRWLQIKLTTPFPDTWIAQQLDIKDLKLKVSAENLLPDLAFSNTNPLDTTKHFLPFGDIPKTGDVLYLASQEAFAKEGAKITISVTPKPIELEWEYQGKNGNWLPFEYIWDQTEGFTKNGFVVGRIPKIGRKANSEDKEAYWIRVRSKGGYSYPPRINKLLSLGLLSENWTEAKWLRPDHGFVNKIFPMPSVKELMNFKTNKPDFLYKNDKYRLDENEDFLPFGTKPGSNTTFEIGSNKPFLLNPIWTIQLRSNGAMLAAGSSDGTVKLWIKSDGTFQKSVTLTGHKDQIWAIRFHPGEELLASASTDGTVKLWRFNNETAYHVQTLEGHTAPVLDLQFSSGGEMIASVSADKTVCIWDKVDDIYVKHDILEGHQAAVIISLFSPTDTFLLATASVDRTVRLWERESSTFTLKQILNGHQYPVSAIQFSSDGQTLVTASADKLILWRKDRQKSSFNRTEELTLQNNNNPILSIQLNQAGTKLIAVDGGGCFWVWDEASGLGLRDLPKNLDVIAAQIHFNLELIALATADNKMHLFRDIDNDFSFSERNELAGKNNDPFIAIQFSPFETLIASASVDGKIELWNTDNRSSIDSLEGSISSFILLRVELNTSSDIDQYLVDLIWESFGQKGWTNILSIFDSTAAFTKNGTLEFSGNEVIEKDGAVRFVMPPAIQKEVNGRTNYWIRARIAKGDYGRPEEYELINSADPTEGFRVKPGTGNLRPLQIESLSVSYEATQTPTIVRQTSSYIEQITTDKSSKLAPFVGVETLPSPYTDLKPSFYIGFDAAFPEQPVSLYIAVAPHSLKDRIVKTAQPNAIASPLPPLQWQYFNGTTWNDLTVIDATANLTESGTVEFLTPTDIQPLAKSDTTQRYWIRVCSSQNDPLNTQQLQGVFLNTVPATQAITLTDEILGSSSGLPNQTFRLAQPPALTDQQVWIREPEVPPDEEYKAILRDEGTTAIQQRSNAITNETETWVRWHEVANFLQSGRYSRHYTLDHTTGLIQFGKGDRGVIPPVGTNNILVTYRTGGGTAGNVAVGAANQLKSAIPEVATVTNPVPADGGAAAETMAMVKQRGPQTLRHRNCAVSATDLEWLARQASGTRVARAKCLPNLNRNGYFEPGWISLLIVPRSSKSKPSPSSALIKTVNDYLENRAFGGLASQTPSHINVMGPGYIQVAVQAKIVPKDIDDAQLVKQRLLKTLNNFLHPLTGGPEGTGWQFGRDVYVSEVCQVIEGTEGVSHALDVQLIPSIAQQYLTVDATPTHSFPVGSIVSTSDHQKSALLAEPIPTNPDNLQFAVKGFQECDRITHILDLTVQWENNQNQVTPSSKKHIHFPKGSLVITADGQHRTRLSQAIPSSNQSSYPCQDLFKEDTDFNNYLQVGDRLIVFYPFPMVITAVKTETDRTSGAQLPIQTLTIEPYETGMGFSQGNLFATLDNRIRLPLNTDIPKQSTVTSIQVSGFKGGDSVTVTSQVPGNTPLNGAICPIKPTHNIVYLDDNFLVYPGAHSFTMVTPKE